MIQNSLFSFNQAYDGGVFYLNMGANIQILNTQFSHNIAIQYQSVGIILNNEATQANYMIGCRIKNNRAQMGTFSFFFAQVGVDSCQFIDNYCLNDATAFSLAQSYLGVSNCTFENSLQFLEREYGPSDTWSSLSFKGFFIDYYLKAFGSVTNSYFRNGIGNKGSSIASGDRSQVQIKFNTFENNYGEKGAIFFESTVQGSISNNKFISNKGDYADIYLTENPGQILVANNQIQFSSGSSVNVRQGKYIIINNTFTDINEPTQQILTIEKNQNIICMANLFLNSNVARVFYFQDNEFSAQAPSVISQNMISNITGSNKGIGMFLENSPNLLIQNNQFHQMSFPMFTGTEEAAGIYIDPSSTSVIVDSNSFTQCRASIGGGVSFKNGFVQFINNSYFQNEASIYGEDTAAFPVSLEFKQYDELPLLYRDSFPRLLSQRRLLDFTNQRSGGTIDGFYLVLVDQYGKMVASSNGHLLALAIENLQSAAYLPKAQSLIEIKEKHGVYDLSVVVFSGEPGKPTKLTLTSSAIDPALSGQSSYSFQVELHFRKCEAGEEYTDDGRCIPCTAGYYSSEAPQGVTVCQKCPANAECFGGTQIAPLPGYWRSSPTSLNFINCYIYSACLGSTADNFNPQGKCYTGYEGILCAQCGSGYVRNAQFQCAKCPAQWKNILLLILILVIAILVIILLIRTTLQSMKNNRSIVSVYFKILANHFQLIILTISFELEWPAQVQTFYDITQPVAEVASRIISLDCFLGTQDQGMKNIYIYLLVYLLLPIFVISGTLIFWFLKIRNNRKKALNRSITTIIILFFLLHPSLTKNVFNIFFCRNIDGISRLIQDLDIECYTGQHWYWALGGGGFGLILWVIGIPWVAWALLRQHKNRLHNQEVKERYGFLFNGYKQRTYYWESVVMFRKVAMIFIAVFLRSLGTRIQAFTVFLLLLFFVIATVQKKPYLTRKLNNLELLSLITSCITIYSGFFFLSSTEANSPHFDANKDFSLTPEGKWLFFLIILFSNLFFILIWSLGLAKEVRGVCRQRFPRFYLCFCLCNKSQLLQEQRRVSKAFEANENIIEEIDNIMLVMKKARHKVVDQDIFIDWNKFMNFIHSSSLQMAKLNLEKLREEDDRRPSNDNFRVKRAVNQIGPKDSKLDVSAEQDFDFSQKTDNFEIEFQEIEQPSLNTSHMTSGTELKPKYRYQRTRFHERVSSITGLASFNTLNDSERMSHRNIPEEDEESIKSEKADQSKVQGEESPPMGIKKNKLKEIAATLLSLPSGQMNPSHIPPSIQQQTLLGKSASDQEYQKQESQCILDFFQQTNSEQAGPSLYYVTKGNKGRRKSVIKDPSDVFIRKETKRSKQSSQKYQIQKMSRPSTSQERSQGPERKKRIVTANTLKSIDLEEQDDLHHKILQSTQLPIEGVRQIQEQKGSQQTIPKIQELPPLLGELKEGERKLEHSSSAQSIGSCESSSDLKVPSKSKRVIKYSSFRNAVKKRDTIDCEKLNLVDSFMNGLEETPQ